MTAAVKVAAPGSQRDARPPVAIHAAPNPGAATRASARERPVIHPRLFHDGIPGIAPDSPYVRRFWTAVIGPTAVAELLRLVVAARRDTFLRRPTRLGQLVAEGLVGVHGSDILVRGLVPVLGPRQLNRLTPSLRHEHQAALTRLSHTPGLRCLP
jgi:hypothetical protein